MFRDAHLRFPGCSGRACFMVERSISGRGSATGPHRDIGAAYTRAFLWYPPGVNTVHGFLQEVQVTSRVSLKTSIGIVNTIVVAAGQAGQEERMVFPARVPATSGRGRFFMMS